jgi:hypothetical protein
MNATTSTTEKASAHNPRPRYIALGTDAEGAYHVYRTSDESIHVITDGTRTRRFDIDDEPDLAHVDHYVAHVDAARGWRDCQYGRDAFLDRLAEAV